MRGLTTDVYDRPPRFDTPAVTEGKRNDDLWRQCMREAKRVDSFDALLNVARTLNKACSPPLDEREIVKIAQSAWNYEERGLNKFGQHGAWLPANEYDELLFKTAAATSANDPKADVIPKVPDRWQVNFRAPWSRPAVTDDVLLHARRPFTASERFKTASVLPPKLRPKPRAPRLSARLSLKLRRSLPSGMRAKPVVERCGSTPTIGADTAAGLPWLSFSSPACGQFGSVDLRTLDWHPGASISSFAERTVRRSGRSAHHKCKLAACTTQPNGEC